MIEVNNPFGITSVDFIVLKGDKGDPGTVDPEQVNEIIHDMISKGEIDIPEQGSASNPTGYATYAQMENVRSSIPTVPNNVSAFQNDAGYLTSIPSEYVTETELNSYGYQTATQVNSLISTYMQENYENGNEVRY